MDIIDPQRRLLNQVRIHYVHSKTKRSAYTAFVFNDMVLLGKEKSGGHFTLHKQFSMATMELRTGAAIGDPGIKEAEAGPPDFAMLASQKTGTTKI